MKKKILKLSVLSILSIVFLAITILLFKYAQCFKNGDVNFALLMTGTVFSAIIFLLFVASIVGVVFTDE